MNFESGKNRGVDGVADVFRWLPALQWTITLEATAGWGCRGRLALGPFDASSFSI
jgi:hypothetical protein